MEHASLFFSVVILTVAVVAAVVWLVLWAYFHRTIATLRLQLRELSSKIGGATTDETLRRVESMQARLARLEPRHLTGRQKTILRRLLALPESAGVTDINVGYDAACGDGKDYAADFVHILGSGRGWRPFTVTIFGSSHRPEAGLAIVCYPQGRTTAGGKLLSKAFVQAGIEHELIYSTEDQLDLTITSRLSGR
jgi:hypothetical protein